MNNKYLMLKNLEKVIGLDLEEVKIIKDEYKENSIETIEIIIKTKGYATDMHKGYANTVKEVLGGEALHTVDPAHLVFLGNRITDQVRQMNDWMIKMGYFEKEREIDISTKEGLKRGRKPKRIKQKDLEKEDNYIQTM